MKDQKSKTIQRYRDNLLELGYSFFKPRVLITATKLDIFNTLGEATMSASETASRLGLDQNATETFLNALVSLGLLMRDNGAYSNTEEGKELFITGKEEYIGDIIKLQDTMWNSWSMLQESITSGKPTRKPDMFQEKREETRIFIRAMHNTAMTNAPHVSKIINLSGYKTLIDIGGGPGTYSVNFCKENKELKSTILDLPGTLEITKELISLTDVSDRITLMEGDFNKNIDGNYDVAFLSNIIHCLGEEENSALIERVYNALNVGGMMVIQDFIMTDEKTSPPFPALFSLNMLLFTENGKSYSFKEIEHWLNAAGFQNLERVCTTLPRSISLLIGKK
ncbi:MAG: SAM-dependent methyltransferase [Planctomycetes bacterium]|nr:SAM-dependent methyltransferase [Planctomycetota bacterium]